MRVDFSRLRVAITGASSGIGAALARELARRGASLAIAARREDRLEAVAAECRSLGAPEVLVKTADVSQWSEVKGFADAAQRALGDVEVVVANSGYGNVGNTLDMDPAEVERLFRTNTVGAIWTVQAFGDQLERRKGHALVVGSIVSKVAVPYSSLYAGSKWALRGWTRGARPELESRNIALTLFNPGYVRTEFFQHRVQSGPVAAWDPGRGMTPEQVGRRIVRAIRRRPAEVDLTVLGRLAIPFYRLMPIQVPRLIARAIRDRADARFIKK